MKKSQFAHFSADVSIFRKSCQIAQSEVEITKMSITYQQNEIQRRFFAHVLPFLLLFSTVYHTPLFDTLKKNDFRISMDTCQDDDVIGHIFTKMTADKF